jgi:hypothetical protein
LSVEERYLHLVENLHRDHIRNQLLTNVITLTVADTAMTMENVRVVPTQAQIYNAITDIASSENNCAICQDSIANSGVRIRHCSHDFHRSCLVSWFAMSVRCPVCRHDVREGSCRSNIFCRIRNNFSIGKPVGGTLNLGSLSDTPYCT